MSEKSSTRMTCLMRWAGDRSRTECTVRSNTDHASLWKQITTLVAGKLSKYRPGSLHLLDNNSKRKKKNNIRLNTSFGTNSRVKSIEWSRRDTGKLKAVPLQLCQKKQKKTKLKSTKKKKKREYLQEDRFSQQTYANLCTDEMKLTIENDVSDANSNNDDNQLPFNAALSSHCT